MPTCLVRAVAAGNLAALYYSEKDKDILSVMELYNQAEVARDTPCIYEIAFVDNKGNGPTANQWEVIVNLMLDYIQTYTKNPKKITMAYQIDFNVHPSHSRSDSENGITMVPQA
jgi:hypothetical protein